MFGTVRRKEIKKRAWEVAKKYYLPMLLVVFIWSFCRVTLTRQNIMNEEGTIGITNIMITLGVFNFTIDYNDSFRVFLATAISIVIYFFVTCPMRYGVFNYFKKAAYNEHKNSLMDGYTEGRFLKSIVVFTVSDFLVAIFTFLLIIPGIIRSIEYTFIPYIMEDYPNEKVMEVLNHSKQLAYGHRMQIFWMDLSLLPWQILGIILGLFTFGVGTNLVQPYIYEIKAQMYMELNKDKYKFDYAAKQVTANTVIE